MVMTCILRWEITTFNFSISKHHSVLPCNWFISESRQDLKPPVTFALTSPVSATTDRAACRRGTGLLVVAEDLRVTPKSARSS